MPLLDQIQHIFSSVGLTCSSVGLPLFPPAAEGASHLGFALLSPMHYVQLSLLTAPYCNGAPLLKLPFTSHQKLSCTVL